MAVCDDWPKDGHVHKLQSMMTGPKKIPLQTDNAGKLFACTSFKKAMNLSASTTGECIFK